MKSIIIFVILCISSKFVSSLPGGAPSQACETLSPQHAGNQPSTSPTPYLVEISSAPIVPGGRSYLLTLRGQSPSTTLKGFIFQARHASDTTRYETFGTFEPFGPTDTDIQGVECISANDTATHTNRNPKGQVIVQWNAPPTGTGTVRFVGAIVDDFSNFYTNQRSAVLTY